MHPIVLSGPSKNALGTAQMHHLLDELRRADGAPLLLTGEGDAFCAGLDLNEVHGLDPAGMAAFLDLLGDLVEALFYYPGPTAVAVQGHAIAGGAILALVCDRRFGATDPRPRFGLTEVALGLTFPPRLLTIVQRCVPAQHQVEVLLGAQVHSLPRAAALGLLDALADDPVAEAKAWLAQVATHPPGAYAAAKAALRPRQTVDEAAWRQSGLPAWTSDALKARIARFARR
jgi:enoyl-CoA hydratase